MSPLAKAKKATYFCREVTFWHFTNNKPLPARSWCMLQGVKSFLVLNFRFNELHMNNSLPECFVLQGVVSMFTRKFLQYRYAHGLGELTNGGFRKFAVFQNFFQRLFVPYHVRRNALIHFVFCTYFCFFCGFFPFLR